MASPSGAKSSSWRPSPLVVRVALTLLAVGVAEGIVLGLGQGAAWQMLALYSILFIAISPVVHGPIEFFRGKEQAIVDLTPIKNWAGNHLRHRRSSAANGSGNAAKSLTSLDPPQEQSPDWSQDHPSHALQTEGPARSSGVSMQQQQQTKEVGFWVLMSSTFISWVFAKSVRNAASLGGQYGIVGGLAYSGWYVSFFSVAIVAYLLRTGPFRWKSLSTAVNGVYDSTAAVAFAVALLYRLYNEVWSNTVVVASFYGPTHSAGWWTAAILSAVVPMIYVLMGGMRSSLISDVLQALIALVLLIVVFAVTAARMPGGPGELFRYGTDWSVGGGLDLLMVALLQGSFSYPFFDPVLTDRAFLAKPATMVRAFFAGGLLGGLYIVMFSTLGVYGLRIGVGGEPAVVARVVGVTFFNVVAVIMTTSSMSTLDSTFTSTSKLVALELGGWLGLTGRRAPLRWDAPGLDRFHVRLGRLSIVVMAVVGTLPVIARPEALDATTISGTIVLGLGPPILLMSLWRPGWRRSPLAFHLPFWFGVAFGTLNSLNSSSFLKNHASWLNIGNGKNNSLLGVNAYGCAVAFLLCLLGFLIHQYVIPERWSTYPHATDLDARDVAELKAGVTDGHMHHLSRVVEDEPADLILCLKVMNNGTTKRGGHAVAPIENEKVEI